MGVQDFRAEYARLTMKKKDKCTPPPPPVPDVNRGHGNFAVIIAMHDWRERSMPKQEPKHPELKRNEVFLMNVTPSEFAWFASGHVHMGDFKKVRLGEVAYKTCSTDKVDSKLGFKPMFGALRRSARLQRKAKQEEKKTLLKEAKAAKAATKPKAKAKKPKENDNIKGN